MLYIFTIIADFFTFDLLHMSENSGLAMAIHFFVEDTLKIFFLTILIIFVMGMFRHSLQADKVRNYINGKPKYLAYLLAVILGWITPFCSCSTIPLFIAFIQAGIPLSVVMTFLVVSPMPIESVAILGALIGFWHSMLYMALCGGAGILFGVLVDRLQWNRYLGDIFKPENHAAMHELLQKDPQPQPSNNSETITSYPFSSMLRDGMDDVKSILSSIWLWLILGIALGALLHGYLPNDLFATLSNEHRYLAIPVVSLVGLPLYANNSSIVPVMEALYLKGVPLGTVLTLMISTTSTSLPQLVILRTLIKKELIWRFIAFLLVAFIVIGLLFNACFS